MSRPASQAALTAIFGEQTDDPILSLIAIENIDTSEKLYFVNDMVEITHNAQVYAPLNFQMAMPSEENGTITAVRLVVDNVSQEIGFFIERTSRRPRATLTFVLHSDPEAVEWGPFTFDLENVSYDALTVTAQLTYADLNTRRYPQHGYTPGWTPELY